MKHEIVSYQDFKSLLRLPRARRHGDNKVILGDTAYVLAPDEARDKAELLANIRKVQAELAKVPIPKDKIISE